MPADELPDWDPRKPKPQLDLSDMSKFKEAEDFLKMSKKGQSVMMFVSVSGNPTRREAEELTGIWQTGLWNTHIHVERFMIEDHRALFLFKVNEANFVSTCIDSILSSFHRTVLWPGIL